MMKSLLRKWFGIETMEEPIPEGKHFRKGHYRTNKNGKKFWVSHALISNHSNETIVESTAADNELYYPTPQDVRKLVTRQFRKEMDFYQGQYFHGWEEHLNKRLEPIEDIADARYGGCMDRIGNTNSELAELKKELAELKKEFSAFEDKLLIHITDLINGCFNMRDRSGPDQTVSIKHVHPEDLSIDELMFYQDESPNAQLRTRAYNGLQNLKLSNGEYVKTAGDVCKFTEKELLWQKNLGRKTLELIKCELEKAGLNLRRTKLLQ